MQSSQSILLSIQSLMNDAPYHNEPSFEADDGSGEAHHPLTPTLALTLTLTLTLTLALTLALALTRTSSRRRAALQREDRTRVRARGRHDFRPEP